MDSMSEIVRLLRAGRVLVGLSQEELADLAGISRQIVARIERGEDNVLLDSVKRVRSALEASGVVFIPSEKGRGPGLAERRVHERKAKEK